MVAAKRERQTLNMVCRIICRSARQRRAVGRFSVALSHQLPGEQGAVMVGRKMLFSAQGDIVPETAAATLQEMGTA